MPLPLHNSLRRLIFHAATHPKTSVTTPSGTATKRQIGAPVITHHSAIMPSARLVTANPLRRFFMPCLLAFTTSQKPIQLYIS
jgi:hypothetical protein